MKRIGHSFRQFTTSLLRNKTSRMLALVLIVLMVPLTVTVLNQQQNLRQEAQSLTPPQLFVKASKNCGGHMEISWTAGAYNRNNGYFLYFSDNPNFNPAVSGGHIYLVQQGPINQVPTASNPYYHWASQPSKTLYYKLTVSGTDGNYTTPAVSSTTSAACGGQQTGTQCEVAGSGRVCPVDGGTQAVCADQNGYDLKTGYTGCTADPQRCCVPKSGSGGGLPTSVLRVSTSTDTNCGGSIRVWWNSLSNATRGYYLYRSTSSNFNPAVSGGHIYLVQQGPIMTAPTQSNPYFDWNEGGTDMTPGSTYYYKVIAVPSSGANTVSDASAGVKASAACGGTGGPPNPPNTQPPLNCNVSPKPLACICQTNSQCASNYCATAGGTTKVCSNPPNNPQTSPPAIKYVVQGVAWKDTDSDGLRDASEAFFPGIPLTVHNTNGFLVTSTTTNSNGAYDFSLNAGTYIIGVSQNPSGWVMTTADDIQLTVGPGRTLMFGFKQSSTTPGNPCSANSGRAVNCECTTNTQCADSNCKVPVGSSSTIKYCHPPAGCRAFPSAINGSCDPSCANDCASGLSCSTTSNKCQSLPASATTDLAVDIAAPGFTPSSPNVQEQATVEVYTSAGALVKAATGTVTFNTSSQSFKGTVNMGNLPSGSYIVKAKLTNSLQQDVSSSPISISSQSVNTVPSVSVPLGDANNDNTFDVRDFNILYDCFNNLASCNAAARNQSDFNGDGIINILDYNLFYTNITAANN